MLKESSSMEIPSSTEWNSYSKETVFTPNVFFDIKETIDKKIIRLFIFFSSSAY